MVAKEAAREVLEALPKDATMDQIIHALYIRAKFDRGEQEIRDGQGVPHDVARQRFEKWLT